MNPSVITYIGFIVAAFILFWGASVVLRYCSRRSEDKTVDTQALQTWIPLKPSVEDVVDRVEDDQEENSSPAQPSRAQQNGHYSESKRLL